MILRFHQVAFSQETRPCHIFGENHGVPSQEPRIGTQASFPAGPKLDISVGQDIGQRRVYRWLLSSQKK